MEDFHVDGMDLQICGVHANEIGGERLLDKLKKIQHNGLKLNRGVQTLRVVMDKQGPSGSIGDIDYFEFRRQ